MPREGGLQWGEIFWLPLATASVQCLRLPERFSHSFLSSLLRCSDTVVAEGNHRSGVALAMGHGY